MLQHIIIFNFSIIISFFLKSKIEKKQAQLKYENIFFYRRIQAIKSFVIVWGVIFCFLIIYRIARFFLRKSLYINVLFVVPFISVNTVLIGIFLFYLLLKIRILVKYYVKKHFLKLHYYCFLRYGLYIFFTKKISNLSFDVVKENIFFYKIAFFIINDLLHCVVILMFLKNIFFDKGLIFIGLLPIYGMYYLCLNYIKFLQQMRPDFERISLQFYYSSKFDLTLTSLQKLYKYHNELIFNEKKYYFDYSFRFIKNEEYPYNWIFINEKEVNDEIFKISTKYKPEFFPPWIKSY